MIEWQELLTLPQLFGWGAFFLGMAGFLQKSDLRFKQFMALECAAYVVHFLLLGQWTASASATVSLGRSVASVRYPFKAVGLFFMLLSLICGALLYTSWISWLPISASVLGTFALFFLNGMRMRFVMFGGTALWLVHNYLVGSVGGTVLEAVLCVTNAVTLYRMYVAKLAQSVPVKT
jgi:hypothetical protein